MSKLQDDKKKKKAAQKQEKKKHADVAAIAKLRKGSKKATYDYDTSTTSLVKSKHVPKEDLFINVPQKA